MGLLDKLADKYTSQAWLELMSKDTTAEAEETRMVDVTSVIYYVVSNWKKDIDSIGKQSLKLIRQRNKIADFSKFDIEDMAMLNPFTVASASAIVESLPVKKQQQFIDIQEQCNKLLDEYETAITDYSLVLFVDTLRRGKHMGDSQVARVLWKMFNFADESFRVEVREELHKLLISYFASFPDEMTDWVKEYLAVKAAYAKQSLQTYFDLQRVKYPERFIK